jgi:hypothetical protein
VGDGAVRLHHTDEYLRVLLSAPGVGDLEVFSGEMFWYYPEVWPTAMECTVYWTFDIDWAGD